MQSDRPNLTINSHWYLAASKPRQELRALENLINQGVIAYCPIVNVEKTRAGKKKIVVEALFPGYIFINLAPDDGLWFKVKSTRGIRDWVKFNGEAAKVPSNLIEKLRNEKQQTLDDLVSTKFEKGDVVRILNGPFEGLSGIYQCSNSEQRSIILVEFLGASNKLNLSIQQITHD